ncbi:MAG: hypothetical protein PHH70_03655 [Candidatus Gracilibacteria bacterium]|nr:hypothetical protein [Candidatus Gracilibacteria bacterium]
MPTVERQEGVIEIPDSDHTKAGALQRVDENVEKILAVIANPYAPRYDNDCFRESLAKTLNLLVVQEVLPCSRSYPYNLTNSTTLVERMHLSLALGTFEEEFSYLSEKIRRAISDAYTSHQASIQD